MSSAVAELDSTLQSMLNLKPPGITGSKINSITALCTANIQSESVLIQKIYTHFKKTPGTHKLGVLYVIDSVTRQWVDHAKKSGQTPGQSGPDGTFAAGVARVTELLPVLMNDIVAAAPEDQKAKIKKLIEIWERSSTFPPKLLAEFKDKLNAPPPKSTTPEGSPAPGFIPIGQQSTNIMQAPSSAQDTSAILEALKNMAAKNNASQPAVTAAPAPVQTSLNNLLGLQPGSTPTLNAVNQGLSAQNPQAVNPLGALFAGMSNGGQMQGVTSAPQNQNPLAALHAQPQTSMPQDPNMQAQTVQLLSLLAAQGVPPDQWGTALQLLNMQNGANGVASLPPPQVNSSWAQNGQSRDRDAYTRSPPNLQRRRSRSPVHDRRREISPRRRRDSPGVDAYRDNRRGGDAYRQRSPVGRRRRSPSPQKNEPNLPPPGPRNIPYDRAMPANHIKVMSRTLFVGGVTQREEHLRSLFAQYGIVQTCIVNIDKRHAFIKMLTRSDAERARTGMEDYRDGSSQLRTKWGVGFGPRDCSDYQTGVSVIPLERLTDADRKWMISAEYGGTGGLPIEGGMVVEEPDIEIGAGVSSKAMSRRIATDTGGNRGPKSSRLPGGRRDDRNDDRMDTRPDSSHDTNANAQVNPNMMANMPFPFPMMNGMPMFPPGFQFPGFPQNNAGEQK